MSYTPTVWKEHSMDTAAKLTALDNLENLYTEAVAYIDSLTHASRYYTKAECDAKYFTSANDGTGSGLIAATLDGYTADQIIAAGIPSGNIGIWSGSEASIPAGWYLCNGSNGTPNLRDRFVVGAGSSYARGVTGGSATATPTAASVTISTYALTGSHLPSHTHGYTDYYRPAASGILMNSSYATSDAGSSTTAASSSAHGHPGSSFSGSSTDVRPPFYALCWIMKS